MADEFEGKQNDPYAERRGQMDDTFAQLPTPGSEEYWRALGPTVPLEVLSRCVRERLAHGARADAERVFEIIAKTLDGRVRAWSRHIVSRIAAAKDSTVDQDLQVECYHAIWQALAADRPTFLVEHFLTGLQSIESRMAHRVMEQHGYWKKPGTVTPTRIPASQIDSMDATRRDADGSDVPKVYVPDTKAANEFDDVELRGDVRPALEALSPEDRALIADVYYRGLTQREIADPLGLTPDAIRKRLNVIYRRLHEMLSDPSAPGGR